jgi:hypothetical protein
MSIVAVNIRGVKYIEIVRCVKLLSNLKESMSQHLIVSQEGIFVFGWDQPLQSFFLQKHDSDMPEEANPVVWLGATSDTQMYEVEDLVQMAKRHGCYISHEMRVKLYGEKDDGV